MEQQTEEIKKPLITKEMTIGEVTQLYPSIVEPLMAQGVHCVGCGAAYFETLEEGLGGHGKTPEEIEKVMQLLNDAIPKEIGNSDTLTITEFAAEKLKEILKKNNREGFGLRIAVIPGGCSGMQYSFEIEEKGKPDDNVIEIENVNFYIDQESMQQLKGAKVDYVDTLQGAGFKIHNPNATKTCGCGQSFG